MVPFIRETSTTTTSMAMGYTNGQTVLFISDSIDYISILCAIRKEI